MISKLQSPLFMLTWGIVFCSCSNPGQPTDTTLSGIINIDGSSTVYPITEAIAEEYRVEAPDVRLTIGISGTGGGFKKFARGETAISNASRPIKETEAQACREKGISFVELTIAYDGLAVVVNPQNNWANELTTAELKKIWEPAAQNTILKWSQVRPGFPDHRMSLLGPGTASGTFDYFTEMIVGTSGSCRGDYMPSEDDHVLVQGVAGDKYALGFLGLAYFLENKDKLRLVAVDAGEGPVLPGMESVKNGTYQPLSRPVFIYISNEAVRHQEVVDFVEFYLKNVAEIVQDVGYIPLPQEEYTLQLEKFRKFIDEQNTNASATN